jgi:hypothetical protein
MNAQEMKPGITENPDSPKPKRAPQKIRGTLSETLAEQRDITRGCLGSSRALELALQIVVERRPNLKRASKRTAANEILGVGTHGRYAPGDRLNAPAIEDIQRFVALGMAEVRADVKRVQDRHAARAVVPPVEVAPFRTEYPGSFVVTPAVEVPPAVEVVDVAPEPEVFEIKLEPIPVVEVQPEPAPEPPTATVNAITVSEFFGGGVRLDVSRGEGNEWVCITDLWNKAGADKNRTPSKWWATDGAKQAARALMRRLGHHPKTDGEDFSAVYRSDNGGTDRGTWSHNLLALDFCGWYSADFDLKVKEEWRDYTTGRKQPPAAIAQPHRDPLMLALEATMHTRQLALDTVKQVESLETRVHTIEIAQRSQAAAPPIDLGDHLTQLEQIHHLHKIVASRLQLTEHETWTRIYDQHDRMFGCSIRAKAKRWNSKAKLETRSIINACAANGSLEPIIKAAKALIPQHH